MRTKSILLIAILVFGLWHTPSVFAADQSADLDQWANAPGNKWQNGDLNPSNSSYREDYVIPYRAKLTNLIVGHSYTLPIEFDTTKAGLHAQDFLMTYNAVVATDPCDGGVCPLVAPTTYPIPIDSNVNNANPPHPILNYLPTDPGIAGLVLSSSTSNPVPGVTVEIYDPSNVLVQTLTTDVDGWFMWQFKYTGKATTFTVKLPAYNLSQPVTLKSNDFAVVNFLIP